jgi:hypothetical protein
MKRFIWLPVAGFLLIAGATVAAAAPALVDTARGLISAHQTASGAVTASDPSVDHPGQGLLSQVLSDLVSKNVITQAQSDAITAALQDKIDLQQADMETRRAQMQQTMQSLRTFLQDGVITQDEINTLPADNPLRQAFDSIAKDGQVTLEQLQGLGNGFGFGFMHAGPGMHGHGPGGHWFGPDPGNDNPGASPSPSTTSSDS